MTLKKTMNSIGWKYGLMGILYILIEIGLGRGIKLLLPESLEKFELYLTFAIMPIDIIFHK